MALRNAIEHLSCLTRVGCNRTQQSTATAGCSVADPVAPLAHESLLRRPAQEDSPSPPPRYGQERGFPHLLREPLLRQTLCQDGRPGALARPEEEARLQAEGRRRRQATAGGRPGGAPGGDALREA